MTGSPDPTIAKCTDCGRVYASYYADGMLMSPTGEHCPNCGGDELTDVRETES